MGVGVGVGVGVRGGGVGITRPQSSSLAERPFQWFLECVL